MTNVILSIDGGVLERARQHADEHGTTLEALLIAHAGVLANRSGRRLTIREQIYVDCEPSATVIERLQAENFQNRR